MRGKEKKRIAEVICENHKTLRKNTNAQGQSKFNAPKSDPFLGTLSCTECFSI